MMKRKMVNLCSTMIILGPISGSMFYSITYVPDLLAIDIKGKSFSEGWQFGKKMAWQELMNIPYGETKSYLAQAEAIGKSTSYRAVANANGANQLAIIIPCHRIINSNGDLGGYGGGIIRKQWLINMEKQGI